MNTHLLPVNKDLEAVCEILSKKKGLVRNAELVKQVRARGDAVQEQLRHTHGVQDDSVRVIREIRD